MTQHVDTEVTNPIQLLLNLFMKKIKAGNGEFSQFSFSLPERIPLNLELFPSYRLFG